MSEVRKRELHEIYEEPGGKSYLSSDPSLDGDTRNDKGRKIEEQGEIKIKPDYLKPKVIRKEELNETSVDFDFPKTKTERFAKTERVRFGSSSMDVDDDLDRSKSDSTLVSLTKESKANFGSSSMDAKGSPRVSKAERVARSNQYIKLDETDYNENIEMEKLGKMMTVLSISVKKANSVRNPTKFIYDTAAGCCICNTREVFVTGSIRMIPDDQVSIVGFNTSHGPAIALGKGMLKYLDIEAYYSENAIGNILGEPKLLESFQAHHDYVPGKMHLDKITVTRQSPREGDTPIVFQRSVEGIMICPVPKTTVEEDWLVCSTLVSDDNDPINVWLSEYGLTERESQAAIVLRKLSEENRTITLKKLLCVLENNHDCRTEEALAKYLIFKSMYITEEVNRVMICSSEILRSLRSWVPWTESTNKETCKSKTCKWTRTNLLNSVHSDGNCYAKLCDLRTLGDSLPDSLASTFSDIETWAARCISKLRLSYGELMVALFAVDAGLAAADTFVAVTLKQKGFTLAGIARLEKVERLHRLTSFVNLRTLKDMLTNKVIEVDGLQPKHIDAFRIHVHESDCACHEGKIRMPSAIKMKGPSLAELNLSSCHIDVMTETTDDKTHRYLYLIGVDAATQCIIEVKVPDLTEKALATGLIVIENFYKQYKKPLTQFVLDNAAGFSSKLLQEECARRHITIVYVPPDMHVKLAEAAIKIIKSLVRTTVVDRATKGKFITSFVTHLITWVVGSINFTLRNGSRTLTPWTRFTGSPISMNIHFRVAFLDMVIVHKLVQERTNNLESRGFLGLVLGRDKSFRGAFIVLNLTTMKICKRYHFKLVYSKELLKFVDEKLNETIFKASYIAGDNSEIATADIEDFEISNEDVAAVYKEVARLAQPKVVQDVEGEMVVEKAATNKKNKKKKSTEVEALITLGHPGNRSATAKVEVIPNSKAFTIDQLPDGSCMFASICFCYARGSIESDPINLRQEVCDYMEKNLNSDLNGLKIEDFIDVTRVDLMMRLQNIRLMSTEDYIKYMRNPASYGDSLELKIIAKIRKIAIIVYKQITGGFEFVEANTQYAEEGKVIYLNYTGDIHYENLIIEKEDIRTELRVKYGIQTPSSNKSTFNHQVNELRFIQFDSKAHQKSLEIQYEINKSTIIRTVPLVGTVKDSTAKTGSSSMDADHSSGDHGTEKGKSQSNEFNEEDFEEETVQTYDEKDKILEYEDMNKICVAFADISLPRPYTSEYEELYEPHSSHSLNPIVTDNDFILCCATFEALAISTQRKDNLRKRLGNDVVDEASRKEMAQILHKKVMIFQSINQVNEIRKKKIEVTPLIDLIKEKLLSNGEHEKVKSRIIVLGNLMKAMLAAQTEAPTAQLQSFYMLVFIAAKRCIRLLSKDVTGAFLNADLEKGEIVYVRLTPKMAKLAIQIDPRLSQYILLDGTMIGQLQKCLYGMGISPQRWFKTIRELLRKLGFLQSSWDLCFFFKIESGDVLNFVLLFVDDLLIACENKSLEARIGEEMIAEFEGVSTQEGDVLSYLGFTITQTKDQITLDQSGYIMKMFKSLDIDPDKVPKYTNPFASDYKINDDRFLKPVIEADAKQLWMMKHLAMSMMYLACRTRRDLLFASSFFAGIKCPTTEDIAAVKRVIIYAYNTVEKKQVFYRQGAIEMSGVGDASHSLFADTRGQGCAIIYGDKVSAALEMTANVEKFFSKSSYESELVLQNKLAMMMKRTMLMFKECGIPIAQPMNQSCDHLEVVKTMNQEHLLKSGPSKFMSRNIFQLFAEVVNKIINFEWVKSKRNLADIGTKDLRGTQFQLLAEQTFSRLVGLPEDTSDEDFNKCNSKSE
jgi:hypothetical protein